MPDRDAEIAAMVDEFLADSAPPGTASPVGARRSKKQLASDRIWGDHHRNEPFIGQPSMSADLEITTDQTPLDDVIHSGVIGTEE